jgi:dTMP kinase
MLINLEGVDGAGKSTQIALLASTFKDAIITKEPGATPLGTQIRKIILGENLNISHQSEMFLFLADRAEHYEKIIKPNRDKIVFCDRSFVSGIAYAMTNLGLNLDEISRENLNTNLSASIKNPNANLVVNKTDKNVNPHNKTTVNLDFNQAQIWQKFQMLINLNKIALQNDFNAKFVFLKIDEASLISRLKIRIKEQNIKADTIEKRGISYLLKVQKNIENVIEILGLNALKIDANLDKNEILNQIKEFIK